MISQQHCNVIKNHLGEYNPDTGTIEYDPAINWSFHFAMVLNKACGICQVEHLCNPDQQPDGIHTDCEFEP